MTKPNQTKCPYCTDVFRSGKEAEKHVKSQHPGKKPYVCNECNKTFTDPSNLNHHKIIHTGKKPYKCNFCVKEFNQKVELTFHMRKHHTYEKPYKCDFCGKEFASNSELTLHMRRHHTHEKPFKCSGCKYASSQSSDVQRHIKIKHKDGDAKLIKPRKVKDGDVKEFFTDLRENNQIDLDQPSISSAQNTAQQPENIVGINYHYPNQNQDYYQQAHPGYPDIYNNQGFNAQGNNEYTYQPDMTNQPNAPLYRRRCNLCDEKFYIDQDLKTHYINKHPLAATSSGIDGPHLDDIFTFVDPNGVPVQVNNQPYQNQWIDQPQNAEQNLIGENQNIPQRLRDILEAEFENCNFKLVRHDTDEFLDGALSFNTMTIEIVSPNNTIRYIQYEIDDDDYTITTFGKTLNSLTNISKNVEAKNALSAFKRESKKRKRHLDEADRYIDEKIAKMKRDNNGSAGGMQ